MRIHGLMTKNKKIVKATGEAWTEALKENIQDFKTIHFFIHFFSFIAGHSAHINPDPAGQNKSGSMQNWIQNTS